MRLFGAFALSALLLYLIYPLDFALYFSALKETARFANMAGIHLTTDKDSA
jgi:hypothetical protein